MFSVKSCYIRRGNVLAKCNKYDDHCYTKHYKPPSSKGAWTEGMLFVCFFFAFLTLVSISVACLFLYVIGYIFAQFGCCFSFGKLSENHNY